MIIKTPQQGIATPLDGKAESVTCETFKAIQVDPKRKQLQCTGLTFEAFNMGSFRLPGGRYYVSDDATGVILHPLGG